MNSMTGYGKADYRTSKLAISVEVASVNNRFLEYYFRLPKQLMFFEPKVKELVATRLNRGKVNLTLNYEDYGFGIDRLSVSANLADEIYRQLAQLKKKYKLAGEIEIGHFMSFQDIFKVEKINDLEKKIWPLMSKAINRALDELITMREREGANLRKDILLRLKLLTGTIDRIEKSSPENLAAYREKLAQRIKEVLDNRIIEGARLEEEVAYLAERADITEECVRFKSHLKQFVADVKSNGPVGKRLNFILQELNREANTIGSKVAGAGIARMAMELKEEIEKIREQVQNIE
ncbi:MAG: YicC family protein [candidate division Zixibacteria bacterium]|nr:YicC family protein [candidate division Zixibacteria bacterium]